MSDLSTEVETVHHQFADAFQQQESTNGCMWLFLATEIMFFGALFVAYTVYRVKYPEVFNTMSRYMDIWKGTINTLVLLTSSLTMALAVNAAHHGKKKKLFWMLFITFLLASAFLGIKLSEWHHEAVEGFYPPHWRYAGEHAHKGPLFFSLYFLMTGLHGIHVIIGMGLILLFMILTVKNRFSEKNYTPVEILGLYWHFVDLVWIFLYPLFYLIDRS